jgi:hypothetical protein
MIFKKACRILGGVIFSIAILCSTSSVNAENSTYVTRDAFYNLNDQSVNRLTSEHFQIIWGKNDKTGTVNEAFVKGNLENLEAIRDFYVNVIGFDDTSVSVNSPINSSTHYKTNLYINQTGLSKIEDDWAYMSGDSGGFAYLALQPGAMRVDEPSWVVPHEYAHAITMHQRGNISAPWYETTANWLRDQYLGSTYYKYGNKVYGPTSDFFQPIVLNSEYYFPHMKNYYDAWPFLLYVTENPDNMTGLGLDVMKNMFHDTSDEIMFNKLQRLSGTSTKDMLGGYARRMVTMDFKRQSSYLKYLNEILNDSANYSKIYTTLENTSDGWLKVPDSKAPQQGGYNIIPLTIDLSSKQVTINFKGDTSAAGADFRASIVTKTKSGKTRYSTMWNSGNNSINLQGDEEQAYLVVCATPDKMLDLTSFDVNAVGTKYSYKIQVATNGGTGGTGQTEDNIASKAKASASYCSEWEKISALNDGYEPSSSSDRTHDVYGNWPETGTQWVQYDFDKEYSISQCEVYWFKDGQGIDVPKSYKIQYWNGSKWVNVKKASGLKTAVDQFNTTTFTPVTTNSIKIEMVSNGSSSTGILEWKVRANVTE